MVEIGEHSCTTGSLHIYADSSVYVGLTNAVGQTSQLQWERKEEKKWCSGKKIMAWVMKTTALLSTYGSAGGAVSTAMDSGASVDLSGSWETRGRPQKHGS